MSKGDVCDFCKGTGKNYFNESCVYCNGTGEWNYTAQSYVNNHICQCILLDRKFCPVCNKKCHHDSSLNPKQKIDPGFGGASSKPKEATKPKKEEELVIT